MKADYEELYDLKRVKKQSQSFDIAQDRFFIVHCSAFRVLRGSYCVMALSFLRKQESRLISGFGFCIECGMTALIKRFTECDLKKQSQC